MNKELLIMVLIFLIIRKFRIRLPKFRGIFFLILFLTGNLGLSFAGGKALPAVASLIHLVLYGALFLFLIKNTVIPGMIIAGIGSGLNLLSLITHGGKMPVSAEALISAGQDKVLGLLTLGKSFSHTLMSGEDPFKFLGDVIPTPAFYPFPKVVSVGDLLLFAGLFLFLIKLPSS